MPNFRLKQGYQGSDDNFGEMTIKYLLLANLTKLTRVKFRNGVVRGRIAFLVGLLGRRRRQVGGATHARRQGLSFSSRTRDREGRGRAQLVLRRRLRLGRLNDNDSDNERPALSVLEEEIRGLRRRAARAKISSSSMSPPSE